MDSVNLLAALCTVLGVVGGLGISWGVAMTILSRLQKDVAEMVSETRALRRHVDKAFVHMSRIEADELEISKRVRSLGRAQAQTFVRIGVLEQRAQTGAQQ